MSRPSTATRILDVAERLVQVRGFNGFSYADISDALGIRKASLHHHFPTKADLGKSLVVRYTESFSRELERIERSSPLPRERLTRYVGLYAKVIERKRMCLCGMMAADIATLPLSIRVEVNRFFEMNEAWVAEVLGRGRAKKALRFKGTPSVVAKYLVSTLEGAMLVARSFDDFSRFEEVAQRLREELGHGA